jgi:hypothetical protein
MHIPNQNEQEQLSRVSLDLRIPVDEDGRFCVNGVPGSQMPCLSELIGYYLIHAHTLRPSVSKALVRAIIDSMEEWNGLWNGFSQDRKIADLFLREVLLHGQSQFRSSGTPFCCSDENPVHDFLLTQDNREVAARAGLSAALGLRFPVVEWQIENANPARISEFIQYYDGHKSSLTDPEINHLGALIIHSLECLLHERDTGRLNDGVAAFDFRDLDSNTRAAAQQFLLNTSPTYRFEVKWHLIRNSSLRDFRDLDGYQDRLALSTELGLQFPGVDWPNLNADSGRLIEFVDHYAQGFPAQRPIGWFTSLGDVILASLNEICKSREPTRNELDAVRRFLQQQRGEQATNVSRWVRIGNRRFAGVIARTVLSFDNTHVEAFFHCDDNNGPGKGCEIRNITEYLLNCAFGFCTWFGNQDWDLCNRDAGRLREFLEFYLSLPVAGWSARNSNWKPYEYMLAELIWLSLEVAEQADPRDPEAERVISEFEQRVESWAEERPRKLWRREQAYID